MKASINSRWVRQGRALVALALAVVALIWLLGTWAGLPAAQARGPGMPDTAGDESRLSATTLVTSRVYLPIVFRSDVIFFDDFSSTSSGWPNMGTWPSPFSYCYTKYDTANGVYRVKISGNGKSCIVPNLVQKPNQFYGTFKVKVRRTSDAGRKLSYGFIFDAGPNATDENGTRWALDVFPNNYSDCNNKPYFWLTARTQSNANLFRNFTLPPDKHECRSEIKTGKDQWNEFAVVRNGNNIKVYIKDSGGVYQLVGNYDNVPSLGSNQATNYPWFDLRVASYSDSEVVIEYDYVELRTSTGAP